MIKFTRMADEHIRLPESCIDKSEFNKSNYSPEYELAVKTGNFQKIFRDNLPEHAVYCTYAWIETDEINTEEFPIAVMDYKPKYSKRTNFIFSEPIWSFMKDERTKEQQQFIDRNFDKLNDMFIAFAKSQGYLTNVK